MKPKRLTMTGHRLPVTGHPRTINLKNSKSPEQQLINQVLSHEELQQMRVRLGPTAARYTDDDLSRIKQKLRELASIVFDIWLEEQAQVRNGEMPCYTPGDWVQ